jgi:hypothetical protein
MCMQALNNVYKLGLIFGQMRKFPKTYAWNRFWEWAKVVATTRY